MIGRLLVVPLTMLAMGTPSVVEGTVDNPVTALPPVSAPSGAHCTVTAMAHDFANSYGAPFTGTLAPPAACPGPWSKVVLDWTGSVAGRQYDRLINVYIGNTEVFRSSTPEPSPTGISWHVAKDISAFIPLLRTTQPVLVELDNIVNETYTGIYHTGMTITYYQADRHDPPAVTADKVVSLAGPGGAYTLNSGGVATATVTLPRDLTGVRMEVYARGGGCDEQWFTAVPNDLAARYPDYLCGGGPYREVDVAVDGTPAGVAQVYPVVYTGGIVPTLWRPIPAIDAFVTRPYDLDLTPFAGPLSDGRPHTISITPYGDHDYWLVDGTLFLDEDPAGRPSHGALTVDTLAATPTVTTTETEMADNATEVRVAVTRTWTVAGYLDTPRGRVVSTVDGSFRYDNTDLVSSAGAHQLVRQRETGTVTARDATGVRVSTWSYPIDVDATVVSYVDGNNYDLRATVRQGRQTTDGRFVAGRWTLADLTDDSLWATGELARSNGTVTVSDGTDWEHYVGTDDRGACYDRFVAGNHGLVTADRLRPC